MRFGNGQIGTVDMHMSPSINDSDMTKPEVWELYALIIIFRCRLPFLKNHILDMHLTVRSGDNFSGLIDNELSHVN